MNYPVAVNGHMPFVDAKKYRERQIRKVIAKHRQRHHSGPEKSNSERSRIHKADTKSLPQLSVNSTSSPRMCRPRFISMPSLESQNNLANQKTEDPSVSTKQKIIQSIKDFFSPSKDSKTKYQPQYTQNKSSRTRAHSAPVDILAKSRINVNCETSSPPGGVSPKRQRTRTVSNISSVMETIEEIPENFVVEGDTDSEDSELNSSSSSVSLSSMLSSQTEPASISRLNLARIDSSPEVSCAA